MLPSEHPHAQHRNALSLQRAMTIMVIGKRVAALHQEGYDVDADILLDKLSERRKAWEVAD